MEMTKEKLQEIADEYGLYTEQDVKNRVSCELLGIGARNEELEKENAQWKQRNETLKDALEHARKVYGDDLEKSYKEIAELKRDKEDLIFIRNQNAKCMCEDKENLVKAKELLKKVIKVTWGEGWNYSLDVKVEAENFLKEIEK